VAARLNVPELRKLRPDILVVDLDQLEVDAFEMLRRLRFVLPECILVVYTAAPEQSWARECHFAGATCVLSKDSDEAELTVGLQHAIKSGCWTDPRFAA
jgi:DNA-binding NarL/FixJ family response regulator